MKRGPYYTSSGKKARNHPDYMKTWWKSRPEKYIWTAARKRAEKRGIEFTIEPEDIIIPERCPIFDTPLGEVHNGKDRENSPCLDRIDNTKGYVKGNISVISFKANRLKSNLTVEILERLMNYVSSANG